MPPPAAPSEYRAAPPSAIPATPQQQRDAAHHDAHNREREDGERCRQVRGLIILALIVLVLSMARAGVDRVFPAAWWRLW